MTMAGQKYGKEDFKKGFLGKNQRFLNEKLKRGTPKAISESTNNELCESTMFKMIRTYPENGTDKTAKAGDAY